MESISSTIEKSLMNKHSKGFATMRGFTMLLNYILKNPGYSTHEIVVLIALQ
jgi:hypothetical protein